MNKILYHLQANQTTCDFNVVRFFQDIYKDEFIWQVSEINYLAKEGSFNNSNIYGVSEIEDMVYKQPEGIILPWNTLLFILNSAFQFYDLVINIYYEKIKIASFEIFDSGSIELATNNQSIIEKFNYWIEEMKQRSGK